MDHHPQYGGGRGSLTLGILGGVIGRGGQQKWHWQHSVDGGEDNMGKICH